MAILALTIDGNITRCDATDENRGKGRCNHITHQKPGESSGDFISRVNSQIKEENDNYEDNYIQQQDIDEFARRIDEIAGCRVTAENLFEVLSKLDPESVRQITAIGFEAAPEFSVPITSEGYGEAEKENQLFFATLPIHGISGKKTAIEQMFNKVGRIQGIDGMIDIESNYMNGLTPDEYFEKQFSARKASISKTVSIAKPGYALADRNIIEVRRDNIVKIIRWEMIHPGDVFECGSRVEFVSPVENKQCYIVSAGEDSIIASGDHLFKASIFDENNKEINSILEESKKHRDILEEKDPKWVCVQDMYSCISNSCKVVLENGVRISKIEKGDIQPTRCIRTNTGTYKIGNFLSHNTARKLYYALSDTSIIGDCGGDHSEGILGCKNPRGFCRKCAAAGGNKIPENVDLIGGLISTNLASDLSQLTMREFHSIYALQLITITRSED